MTSTGFWDRIADRYSKRPIADQDAYQKKLEVTRNYFQPEMEVVELGCGTGGTAILHAPYVKHIRAVDISGRMLEIARDKAEDANIDNVTFEQSAIEELVVGDASVDVILALSLLHLLDDKDDAIERIYKMLKPGGVFVSSTACLGDNMKWFRFVGPVGHFLGLIPLVRIFSAKELADSLANAGFAIDYQWQPGGGRAAFFVAKKPE